MTRRVVITGMGAVTPIGLTVSQSWEALKKGTNGIDKITSFDLTDQKSVMGGEIKDFEFPDARAAKRMDRSSQLAIVAAREAIEDSGIVSGENVAPERFGVMAASGIGGIITLEDQISKAVEKGTTKRVSALMVPMVILNMIAGNLAIEFNAKASCLAVVTACAAGTHSIGEAYRNIKHGYADVILGGGAEASFAPVCFAGFGNMTATSTRTDKDRCSTPFDKERDGFVMGEGAGFFVLEELEHAQKRGAKIYGEIAGYGSTCDAYHITSPSPDGEGAAGAMRQAIADAGIKAEDIDYINAHGTGTPLNDLYETRAVKAVFGEDTKVPISSTKGNIGHLLGAAGSVEAIFSMMAIRDSFIPPTINLKVPDEELDLDYVPCVGREAKVDLAMSNSLGFGGHNGTIILKKFEG
ncbi:MAG: beta-ketoacyl-ACP synthase II [Anaerovoracaceae bacterium]|jgi:3-oxoacyl-[acyl-carrier-protein] synthase II